MQCLQIPGNIECRRVCLLNSHCRSGEICQETTIEGLPKYGYCICRDDDEDGHCSLDDCDDKDPDVHPGGGERCWDEIDNNCNGETDEGCQSEEGTGAATGSLPAAGDPSGCRAGNPVSTAIPLLLGLLVLLMVVARKTTSPTKS